MKHLGLVHYAAGRALGLRGMVEKLGKLGGNELEIRRRLVRMGVGVVAVVVVVVVVVVVFVVLVEAGVFFSFFFFT